MEINNYSFEVYDRHELMSRVQVRGTIISFENFSDFTVLLPFGIRTEVTIEDLDEFFESRCFPRDRINCKELLERYGLSYYEPELICRKTHGLQWDDGTWIKFDTDSESLVYDDIRLR